jgi:hypothetical protein
MNNSNFIRLSGWAFIIGAIAFLPGAIGMLFWESQTNDWDTPPMRLAAVAVFLSPLLLAVGMLGLRARYRIGGGLLLFGALVGGFIAIAGSLGQMFAPVYSISDTYYGVWLGGVFVLYVCLSIFGFLALIEKPMPRWNWLPLAAGMWIPLLPLLAGILSYSFYPTPVIIGLVIMTIAQVMLGYILQADSPQEMAIA